MNNQYKVLIVEDSEVVKSMISDGVEMSGHKVIGEASNGRVALEKTIELKPDVILMDVEMGEMNGIDAANYIHQECPTPIVFVSAYESEDLVGMASLAGASAYLTKPPNPRDIDRALTIAVARHHDVMQLRALNETLEKKTQELERIIAENKTLREILPICCFCKQIRDDEGYWNKVELYIEKHTDSKFTHGICPDCVEKNYNLSPPKKES